MVKGGYHPLDIYLGLYILPFLVKQPDFAPIGSKNESAKSLYFLLFSIQKRLKTMNSKLLGAEDLGIAFPHNLDSSYQRATRRHLLDINFLFLACYRWPHKIFENSPWFQLIFHHILSRKSHLKYHCRWSIMVWELFLLCERYLVLMCCVVIVMHWWLISMIAMIFLDFCKHFSEFFWFLLSPLTFVGFPDFCNFSWFLRF